MPLRRRADGPQHAQPAQDGTGLPGSVRRALRWGVIGAVGCFIGWGVAATASPATASAASLDCAGSPASVVRTLDGVVSGLVDIHGDASAPACRTRQHGRDSGSGGVDPADPTGKALLDTSDAVADKLVRPAADQISRPLRPVTTQVGRLVDRTVDGMTDPQTQAANAGTDAVPVAVYDEPGGTETPDGAAASHRRDGVTPASQASPANGTSGTRESAPVTGARLPAGHALHGDALPDESGHHGVPTGPHGADNSPSSGSGAGGGAGAQACTGATTTAPATRVVRLAPSIDDELPSNAAGKPRVSPD